MEVERELEYLGLEEKKITKGERVGQSFYILKFICLTDSYEVMIFDNVSLVAKLMNLQRYQPFIGTLKLVQNDGKWRVNLIDIRVEETKESV